MAFDFTFPDVGEGIHEGKIVKWLVKEGDQIKADQSLAEIETDKAVVEIPSPKTGTIFRLYHKEGEVIKVGEVLASIEEAGGKAQTAPASAQAVPTAESTPTQPPKVPALKPAAQTGEIPKPPVAAKSATEEKEAVSEKRESTGVVGALEETAPGVLKAPSLEQSGAVFGGVQPTVGENKPAPSSQKESKTPPAQKSSEAPVAEIKSAQTAPAQAPQTQTTTGGIGVVKSGIKAVKKYDLFGYVDRVKYEGVRKAIGDHMVKSITTIPHVTHTDLVDVNKLWKIREKEKKKAEKEGIKLTFMPFFVKAVIAGLKKHPYLNATLDESVPEIILKKYYNIGLAVDTEAGLMVPVIKGADKKSILDLAKEIGELAEKARTRKLNPMDMKGGTFTITNIGSAGGGFLATPVINFPESAILGTGMIQDMPVARNGKVVIRKILPLMVSFDHRALDGAEAARFTMTVKEHLEDPDLMLVEGK